DACPASGGVMRSRALKRYGAIVLPLAICGLMPLAVVASPATDKVLANVRLPPGFKLEVYTDQVPNARSMALGQTGTLFVGTRTGNVYAVKGDPTKGVAESVQVLASKLNMPNGVAFREGALYVAEVNRILRYDGIES